MLTRPLRSLLLLVIVAALAGVGGWLWFRGGAIELAAVHPRRGPAVEAIYATGTVEPEKWARIAPVIPGRIAEVLVREGDRVREGQPLARLDDREARARIAELEAKAAYWREETERAAILADRGIRPKESAQKARSEHEQVIAAINAARQRRADLMVTAPIDGVVLRRDGEVGELAEVKDALFWVGAPRPLRVTAEVDEEDIARVRVGQKVLIKADSFPDRVLEAKVDRVTPKGDPVNKTFRVRVALPDDTPLLIGMTAEINIIVAEHPDALLVPAAAVLEGRLFVIEAGVVRVRPVETGIRGRALVEVRSGVAEGDSVVAAPPPGLKDGDRVRVR